MALRLRYVTTALCGSFPPSSRKMTFVDERRASPIVRHPTASQALRLPSPEWYAGNSDIISDKVLYARSFRESRGAVIGHATPIAGSFHMMPRSSCGE
jgi:hypothetical protein